MAENLGGSDHRTTKADLEDRDGTSALLDDRQHEERVRQAQKARERQGSEGA